MLKGVRGQNIGILSFRNPMCNVPIIKYLEHFEDKFP